jgi:hypothetical protein
LKPLLYALVTENVLAV